MKIELLGSLSEHHLPPTAAMPPASRTGVCRISMPARPIVEYDECRILQDVKIW
jgi:hypothetical protein